MRSQTQQRGARKRHFPILCFWILFLIDVSVREAALVANGAAPPAPLREIFPT